MVTKKKRKKSFAKAGMIFGGLVSLLLGYLLWTRIIDIEIFFAIVLFAAGVLKIVWGLTSK
jgi:hypothetical protein